MPKAAAGVKIAAIESYRLNVRSIKEAWEDDDFVWPSRLPALLVKVTAEDGTYGIGEAATQEWYLGETADQMDACLKLYDGALRGADAGNLAVCHAKMVAVYGGGMPGGRSARCAVDMALHDLMGKTFGQPVHALLGGAHRTRFEMLTNLYHKTPEDMAAACKDFSDRGFKGLKVKVGDVLLAEGWNRETLLAEVAKLEAALEVTPRDVMIDADANQGWESAAWTVSILRQFAGHDNLSIEQPLPYADLAGAVHVRNHGGVPVILDEAVWSAEAAMQIARMGAADRIVLKINRVGGFHEARKTIAICEAAGIGVSVDTNPFTLIGDTAVCQIAACCRMPYPVDCEGHASFLTLGEHDFITGGITIENGIAVLPDAPGLGVDVDWDVLERHQAAS